MKLFRYISGVNKERQEIEMTVPVLTKMTPSDGKMTKDMCFYLTKEFQKNPPEPEDPTVRIFENKPMTLFVKQFGVLTKMTPSDGKMTKDMCFYLTKEFQ